MGLIFRLPILPVWSVPTIVANVIHLSAFNARSDSIWFKEYVNLRLLASVSLLRIPTA